MKKLIITIVILLSLTQIMPISAIELNSNYAYMNDINTGKVYLDIKGNEKIYPASMTKIVTLMCALDKITDINVKVTVTSEDLKGLAEANASVCGFKAGEIVTVEDLLYGVLLPSGADACNTLARITYGNTDELVKAMNQKVKDLNLSGTHYVNVTGLHHDEHYTTCHDMSVLLKEALKNDTFKEVFESRVYTISSQNKTWYSSISRGGMSLNRDTSHINGGKSGFTYEARLTYAASMNIEGHDFICVVADADYNKPSSNVEDILNIYDYIEDEHENIRVISKDENLSELSILKTKHHDYKYTIDQDIEVYLNKDITKEDLDISVEFNEKITAPLSSEDKIGHLKISYNNELLYSYDLLMNEDISTDIIGLLFYYSPYIAGVSAVLITALVIIRKRK